MIKMKYSGYDSLSKHLYNIQNINISDISNMKRIAEETVQRLKDATPVDTGLTASSWSYEIKIEGNKTSLLFLNSNIQNGVNIALILDSGHLSKDGNWISGYDYINPVTRAAYYKIINNARKELIR
jgi:hypothetical protein